MPSSTIATPKEIFSRSDGNCSALSVGFGRLPPITSSKIAGMISATQASSSISDCVLAAVRSNVWRSRLSPPTSIAAPITSRTLPRIEPTSEALTTSSRPSRSAKKAMISSGALPNVTFRKPPMPGPERAASSSVARPISAAVGITPSAEATKISDALACVSSSAIAIGMNGTSRYGQPDPESRNRRRLKRSAGWVTAPSLRRAASR